MRRVNNPSGVSGPPPSALRLPPPRSGFTLVELLVVIVIIAILVGLLLPAIGGAQLAARQARITAEMNQLNAAIEDYKNTVNSYPPNAQVDGGGTATLTPIDDQQVLQDFKRHLKQAFPKHREPKELVEALCGHFEGEVVDQRTQSVGGETLQILLGGMTAPEALVFWMGGFSDDPKYPISGIGGPSYAVQTAGATLNNQTDPIEGRKWRLGVSIDRLGPRDDANYFFQEDGRFIEYADPQSADPGSPTFRRINFWHLTAPGSIHPYAYFDASRGDATAANDAPAASQLVEYTTANPSAVALNQLYQVHAIKRLGASSTDTDLELIYASDGKFQLLHAGVDDAWGELPRVNPNPSYNGSPYPPAPTADLLIVGAAQAPSTLLFPGGPWTLDLSDTLTNFTDGTLEDAQP